MNDPAEIFRVEAFDLLDQLEQALLDLEKNPSDQDVVNSAFRALHTLKGSGAMFGFEAVSAFVHNFETAFDHVRKGKAQLSQELLSLALLAKDHIRALVETPEGADAEIGQRLLAGLEAASEIGGPDAGATSAGVAAQGEDDGPVTWRLRFRFGESVLINGGNPLLLIDELRTLGECEVRALTDDVPTLDALDPRACRIEWEATLTTSKPRSEIEDVFIFVMDEMTLAIERVGETVETPAPESAIKLPVVTAKPVQEEQKPLDDRRNFGRRATDNESTMRVQAERVDELMDRVGELVIAQARLSQLAQSAGDLEIKAVAEEIERLASGLRDITTGIRMLPIGSLFSRFRRLVYDLARDLNKSVELTTSGEDTELDKSMIERLADPLVHLIRNALDHGLEEPSARLEAGKEVTGQLSLSASHSGAEVLISIRDDGRGLDAKRLYAKAVAQGLIGGNEALTDADIHQLIFHPGFSTAESVTKLSGRGVGMDVVKRTIEAMRGTIDVASEPGKGCELILRLPLTLAIIEGLLVRVGAGFYVIPLSAIEECVELSQAARDTGSKGRSFLNIRGDLVPFLVLRDLFETKTPPDAHQKIVIVSSNEQRVGLVVDQIIGSHQTVIKSLSKLHADVTSFSGATILGDGAVALILDIPRLVDLGQSHEKGAKAKEKELAW